MKLRNEKDRLFVSVGKAYFYSYIIKNDFYAPTPRRGTFRYAFVCLKIFNSVLRWKRWGWTHFYFSINLLPRINWYLFFLFTGSCVMYQWYMWIILARFPSLRFMEHLTEPCSDLCLVSSLMLNLSQMLWWNSISCLRYCFKNVTKLMCKS